MASNRNSRTQRQPYNLRNMNLNQKNESDPRPNESNHLNWELFVIWSLVVVSFVALFFAGYSIWAKCQGNSPYEN